jgi:DNA processing protein
MWTESRIAKLSLASFPFFGSRSLRKIWKSFPDPRQAWLASSPNLAAAGLTDGAAEAFVEWRAKINPQELLTKLEAQKIQVIFRGEPGYPQVFETSSDPPEILFVRGLLKDVVGVAVVGTRRITAYGKRCVELIVPDLARAGLAIISGLALGIDAAVHAATLDANGYTIAVLGTGVDDEAIYPRENFNLAQRIINEGGSVISEFPPGADSRKEHFPMRNRLIASLAAATVVVEAAESSGSLITARLALEDNREVLAVPGPIYSDQSKGANNLLASGAKPCTCANDVLAAMAFDQPELIAQARASLPIDAAESAMLELMNEPLHIDRLARLAGLDAATTSAKIALLELKGLVKSMGGQTWIKTK